MSKVKEILSKLLENIGYLIKRYPEFSGFVGLILTLLFCIFMLHWMISDSSFDKCVSNFRWGDRQAEEIIKICKEI